MGINDLWSELSPGFSHRVAFPLWVARFVQEFDRPPKVAIDGFMLLFQSRHLAVAELSDDAIVRMFLAKLVYLSSLNVSYVVVFDGKDKPYKQGSVYVGTDMAALDELGSAPAFQSDILWKLKAKLVEYSISFVQCPGEGEAECAMLQKTQVVDYVLSNDVDSLVFGATKVLRNFSRFKEDKPASAVGTDAVVGDFHVTPVHMDLVTERTGLDFARLILIATIRGGDYSSGVGNIGIKRAVRIALCGTSFASFYHRSPTKVEAREIKKGLSAIHSDPLPDFSRILLDCFVDPLAPDRIRGIDQRKVRLKKFLKLLNSSIQERSRDILERKANNLNNLFIDESFTILYLFPKVSSNKFTFKRNQYSYGEDPVDQVIPSDTFEFNIKYLVLKLLSCFHSIPELKSLMRITRYKIIDGTQFVMVKYQTPKLEELIYPRISISQEDEILEDQVEPEDEVEVEAQEKRLIEKSIWIPCASVKLVSPTFLDIFHDELEKKKLAKSSPKKVAPLQRTTLDSLWGGRRRNSDNENSPSKKGLQPPMALFSENDAVAIKDELVKRKSPTLTESNTADHFVEVIESQPKVSSITELANTLVVAKEEIHPQSRKSPKTRNLSKISPVRQKRSPRKKQLLPGQSLLTSFFSAKQDVEQEVHHKPEGKEDPFLSKPLFIDSDSDSEVKPRLMTAPDLSYSIPAVTSKRLISSAGLAETSPTKRSHSLQLSPDNSPLKGKDRDTPTLDISPLKRGK